MGLVEPNGQRASGPGAAPAGRPGPSSANRPGPHPVRTAYPPILVSPPPPSPEWARALGWMGGLLIPGLAVMALMFAHEIMDRREPATGDARILLVVAAGAGLLSLMAALHPERRVAIARGAIMLAVGLVTWLLLLHPSQQYGYICHILGACEDFGAQLYSMTAALIIGLAFVGAPLLLALSPSPRKHWLGRLWVALGAGLGLGMGALAVYHLADLPAQAARSAASPRYTPAPWAPIALLLVLVLAWLRRRARDA